MFLAEYAVPKIVIIIWKKLLGIFLIVALSTSIAVPPGKKSSWINPKPVTPVTS
jgi:hypothetical protein